jgi:hypothetical protein
MKSHTGIVNADVGKRPISQNGTINGVVQLGEGQRGSLPAIHLHPGNLKIIHIGRVENGKTRTDISSF